MIKNIDHANVIHYGFESLIIKTSTNGISKPQWIKVLKEEFPSTETLLQLDNEFEICSNAKCSVIRKAFKKEKQEDHDASVDLGTGNINYKQILKTASENGMQYYIVEQEKYENSTPIKSAQTDANYLKTLTI